MVAKRNAADTRTFGSANMRHTSVLLERNIGCESKIAFINDVKWVGEWEQKGVLMFSIR